MSKLNSKFDIVSVDNPMASAALAQVLEVAATQSLNANGTPVAGAIPAGAIVRMDSTGKAVLATTPDATTADMLLTFVAIDGNDDFSGSFVWKLTVLHGGFTMSTDQYDAGAYTPGAPVSFNAGKIKLAAVNDQVIGYVGPAGLNSTDGVLQVIVPQGTSVSKK